MREFWSSDYLLIQGNKLTLIMSYESNIQPANGYILAKAHQFLNFVS